MYAFISGGVLDKQIEVDCQSKSSKFWFVRRCEFCALCQEARELQYRGSPKPLQV